MLTLTHLAGFGGAKVNTPLIQILTDLTLTTNLEVCLDAADPISYTSGQSWLDRSGNGFDFFRGATSGSEASDPTFDGGEYFSLDGGDYFRYDTTNETWMQNIHKNNAIFSLLVAVYDSAATAGLAGTVGNIATGTGFTWQAQTNAPSIQIYNAGVSVMTATSGNTRTASAWNILGVSVNEATGAGGVIHLVNGSTDTDDSTYTSPDTGNATQTMEIMARGNAQNPAVGGRISCFAAWEGTALTAQNFTDIYARLKGRFSI